MRLNLLILGCLCLSWFCPNFVMGQTIDPIERAKMYPPSIMQQRDNQEALSAIDWQISRLQVMLDQYQSSTAKISESIEKEMERRNELASRLPQEVRMIDASVRSQLIGKAMEELLNAKLDLATQEATITTLAKFSAEQSAEGHGNTNLQESQLAIRMAEKKVESIKIEVVHFQKLKSAGINTQDVWNDAAYRLDVAKLELEKAILQGEQAKTKPDREVASRITEMRVGIEPLKARIGAAEKFLKSFLDSAEVVEKMERTDEGIKAWNLDKRVVVGDLIKISRELDELKVLKRLMEADLKNKPEKPAAEPNDSLFSKE